MDKLKVKLTNVKGVFIHPDLADRTETEAWIPDEKGKLPIVAEYKKGDVVELSKATAEHLVMSGQAEWVNR